MSVSSLVDWGCTVSEPLRIGVRPFVSIWACELEVNELILPSASVVKKRGGHWVTSRMPWSCDGPQVWDDLASPRKNRDSDSRKAFNLFLVETSIRRHLCSRFQNGADWWWERTKEVKRGTGWNKRGTYFGQAGESISSWSERREEEEVRRKRDRECIINCRSRKYFWITLDQSGRLSWD